MNLALTDTEAEALRYTLEWLNSPALRSIEAKLAGLQLRCKGLDCEGEPVAIVTYFAIDGPVCEMHRQAAQAMGWVQRGWLTGKGPQTGVARGQYVPVW